MTLGSALLDHLGAQLDSARRLLDHVLRQGQAIRRQAIDEVLDALGQIQGEMERRGRLEADRAALLQQAGARLGLPAHAVTLEGMGSLLDATEASAATQASAELRGLLAEIQREHGHNRALMRQELSFLDHLTRMLGGEDSSPTGYARTGQLTAAARGGSGASPFPRATLRSLDLQA